MLAMTLGLLATLTALAYFRVPLLPASLASGVALLLLGGWCEPPLLFELLLWLLLLVVAIPLNVPALRQKYLTSRAFSAFKQAMPALSQTEREALEAGTVWWDGELFSGRPHWQHLLDQPAPRLSQEEQAFLDGPVEQLCAMLDDWQITHTQHDLPADVWAFLKSNGFFGMIIPKSYGGLEFSALAHSSVVGKIASRSITAAVTVMVPNSLGPAELLLHYGTQAQKDYYLPRLAKGEDLPCFALTGPEAGSDASAMPDTGIICRGEFQGEEITGIRLNWNKRYITLGPVATVLGLAFKLYDPDHLLGDKDELGITCALIPTNTPGVVIGRRHAPLNMVFQNGPNQGHDVFIPLDWIIGGPARAGQGWRMLMECLAAGRSISLPALSTGAGKLASRAIGAYARVRTQFKTPIGQFGGVEEALARIGGHTYMMEATRRLTTQAVDLGEKPAVISAIAKYNLTERMRQVINDAMDVQGGAGICLGPRNWLARAYQSIPISITVEGANILTRSLIIFGQGAVRCHPYVRQEMHALANDDLDAFDHTLFAHIGLTLSNTARALVLGLSAGHLARAPLRGPEAHYYRQIDRMSAAFALIADVAMLVLGGKLKRMEPLSGRLADALSQLYLISAALKRFRDDGQPADDLPLLRWACNDALYRLQTALDEFLRNFPNRTLARTLRLLVFPLGLPYRRPSDALGHQVAALLLSPGSARDRLTAGIYLSDDTSQALGRLDDALRKLTEAEPLAAKLRELTKQGELDKGSATDQIHQALSKGLITFAEADILSAAEAARVDAIQVDDFDADIK